jgi:hypothetical protein
MPSARVAGRFPETPDDDVAVVVRRQFVNPPARDAELLAEVGGDRLRDLLDREARGLGGLDLLEGAFDLGEEAFVVHARRGYFFTTRSALVRAMRSSS